MSGTSPTGVAPPREAPREAAPVAGSPEPRAATSPRLTRFITGLESAGLAERTALTAEFWAAVERDGGTPLVEELDGEPGHRVVTFLWRGHRATRQVLLLANRLVDRSHFAGSLLSRAPGTDVWYLTRRLRADHRGSYRMVADISTEEPPTAPEPLQERLRALSAYGAPDPLNPRTVPGRWEPTLSSVFELPQAPEQPWQDRRTDVARGTVQRHRIPGVGLGGERDVWVYLPPGIPAGTPAGAPDAVAAAPLDVLVLPDGDMWFGSMDTRHTLDALIADGAVPPLIVLAPDSVDNTTRWQELGARDAYADFLADELLPWAAERWPVTRDPARSVIAGQSLGGMTALYACFRRPERFGNALAQSPSLWWRPGLPKGIPKAGADEFPWLAQQFTDAERRDIRIHIDVGLHEGAMVDHSRTLHDALRARGYPVTRTEFNGGHDYACWRGGLADGLVTLLGH